MRLMRNEGDGRGKYTVIDNRTGKQVEDEFFVIMLKDIFASSALLAYALAASSFDQEYADDVAELAIRSGPGHPNYKFPD